MILRLVTIIPIFRMVQILLHYVSAQDRIFDELSSTRIPAKLGDSGAANVYVHGLLAYSYAVLRDPFILSPVINQRPS